MNEPATRRSSVNWRLVFLLTAVATSGYVGRVAVTVAAPGMMNDFNLSQEQIGTVFSAFLIGYTLFQVPSGALADRVNARRIFLVLCFGWTLLSTLTAFVAWGGYGLPMVIPQLWLVRAAFGIVAAPMYPTSGRTIAATASPDMQARANSFVLSSVGTGSAIAPVLLVPIANSWGWRVAMIFAASFTAVAGLLWFRLAPRTGVSTRTGGVGNPVAPRALPASQRPSTRPLRSPGFWLLCGSYMLQAYLGYIFVFWFYLYLIQVRHFDVLEAAGFTVLPWVATIIAIPVGGVLSDAAVAHWGTAWGRRSVPLVALCAAAVFLIIGARTSSAIMAALALTACTVLVLCTEGPFWATMIHLSGEQSGVAGGIMNFGGNLGGVISPALTPWLAERVGWGSALSLTAGLAVVAALLWLGIGVKSWPPTILMQDSDCSTTQEPSA